MNFRHQKAKVKYLEPSQNDLIKFSADLYIKLDRNVANNAVTNRHRDGHDNSKI